MQNENNSIVNDSTVHADPRTSKIMNIFYKKGVAGSASRRHAD
jgi:hypothetical protein